MGTVELRGDLHGEVGVSHRLLGHLGVRRRRGEVAAECDEDLRLTVAQRADGVHGVQPVLARRVEDELLLDRVEELLRRALPDPHRPVALHFGVPAHWEQARTGPADVALQQGDVGDLLDGRDRVAVLGDAHRPAKDGGRGVAEHAGGFLDLGTAQVGGPLDGGPVQVAQVLCPVLEADRVPLDEVQVGAAPLQQQGPDGLQQGEIAVDAHREMQVGELGAHAADPAGRLRVLEPDETRLLEGVDGQDLGAVLLRLLQDGEHPRVVVPGFWLMITISLASYTSRIVTLALPMPVTS